MGADEAQAKTDVLKSALASWFECEPDDIGYFIIGCERRTENDMTFSSVYSSIPHWYLLGFVDELKQHVENLRSNAQMERMLSEGDT